jgi:DNA adenine methylase
MKMIKSPLRYPGGKSRAIKIIERYFPENFSEYREPFVGGGSLFIYIKQKYPDVKIWINDLNPELFMFWKVAQSDLERLVAEISKIRQDYSEGRFLFNQLTQVNGADLSELERAVRFFVLNRITFSGTIESGGFSQESFAKRFTDSSIERLKKLKHILNEIQITNLDYSEVLKASSRSIFTFLDPPYFSATQSRLYGKKGGLHTSFDHQRFAETVKSCSHQWLITYDHSPTIIENFQDFMIEPFELQYGMNNYKQQGAAKGKELLITNYKAVDNSPLKYQQLSLDLSQ